MRSYEVRELLPEDMPSAVDLWVSVFGVEAPFFQTLLDANDSGEDRSYGVFSDGVIVSSVHVFSREIRSLAGDYQKVGCIGSVSTHEGHRKLGYSGMLLEAAIKGMEEMGCTWSFLGTGVNDHYARYGWRTISTPSLVGLPLEGLEVGESEELDTHDPTLEQMAHLWDHVSHRPQAMLRTPQMWRSATRYRLGSSKILGIRRLGVLTAYLVYRENDKRARIVDAAWSADSKSDAESLLKTALARLGNKPVHFSLPQSEGLAEVFRQSCQSVSPEEDRAWMVRPIADRISWPDLAALHADPRGARCHLDDF